MPGKQITLLDDSQWPSAAFGVELPIRRESAALVVVDMQHYCIDAKGHLADSVSTGHAAVHAGYEQRVQVAITNVARLLGSFRGAGRRVVYTRHGIQTPGGQDLVLRRRGREAIARDATDDASGHMAANGTHGYEIIPDLAPREGELVLDKNTSSAFHTTPIDLYLRNMGIDTIICTGVAADQCVFATALDAADRGFHVIIARDACANLDPGSAEAVQILFGRVWGYVMLTDDILTWLETGTAPTHTHIESLPGNS